MRRFVRRIGDIGKVIAAAVSTSANETITGAWTFSTAPSIANPDITGTAPATPVAGRLYKDTLIGMWVNFNGTTNAISDDVNATSITDNGTGDYTVNIETDFANATYCALAIGTTALSFRVATFAVGSVRVQFFNEAGTATDSSAETCVLAVGDM